MWMNQLKTVILLGSLSGILLVIGSLLGGQSGLMLAFVLALAMNGYAYFYSDTMVLKMYNAQPLDQQKFGFIYQMVKELTHKDGLPMPKLWLVDLPMANAFATGRNPAHASVAVTSGILTTLNEKELRGVLAHEISHIKNRDILVSSVAAVIATTIGYVANWLRYMSFYQSTGNNQKRLNPLVTLLIALVMPLAASLIQLAISRSREYLADESGAELSHDPLALASALKKIEQQATAAHVQTNDATKATTAHLFIINPFTSQGIMALFATHPPVAKRVEILETMYNDMTHSK